MCEAGCPYDHTPMERYFNKLKTELIHLLFEYNTEEVLYQVIKEFVYVEYNLPI